MFRQEEERANDSWIIKLICIVARYDRRGREKRQGMGMGGGRCYRGRGEEALKIPPVEKWEWEREVKGTGTGEKYFRGRKLT